MCHYFGVLEEAVRRGQLNIGTACPKAAKQWHAQSISNSATPPMRYAMPNKWLEELGLLSLKQLWCDLAPLRGTA